MADRPIIMIVDDEPEALAALRAALERQLGADYRVVSHLSAGAALEELDRIGRCGDGDSLAAEMSDYLVRAILRRSNVEIRLATQAVDGEADRSLERIVVRDRARGHTETVSIATLFVFIDARPHTAWLVGSLLRDRDGFVFTGRDIGRMDAGWRPQREPLPLETSPGVFAAGDVQFGSVKRVASAVGDGSAAVSYAHEYLAAPAALRGGSPLPVSVASHETG